MSGSISRRTGRARRFSGGVSTVSLPTRLLFTAVLALLGAVIVDYLVKGIQRPDTRVSAFLVFLAGVWAVTALLTLPYVWQSSAEWQRDRLHARRLQRDLQAALDPRLPRHLQMTGLQPSCPVCGQDGVVLVPSKMQCTACQRPWLARAS